MVCEVGEEDVREYRARGHGARAYGGANRGGLDHEDAVVFGPRRREGTRRHEARRARRGRHTCGGDAVGLPNRGAVFVWQICPFNTVAAKQPALTPNRTRLGWLPAALLSLYRKTRGMPRGLLGPPWYCIDTVAAKQPALTRQDTAGLASGSFAVALQQETRERARRAGRREICGPRRCPRGKRDAPRLGRRHTLTDRRAASRAMGVPSDSKAAGSQRSRVLFRVNAGCFAATVLRGTNHCVTASRPSRFVSSRSFASS